MDGKERCSSSEDRDADRLARDRVTGDLNSMVWNDLLVALVFASPSHAITYAVLPDAYVLDDIDIIGPGAFLSTIVPLAVFFGFQRYFVQGVSPAR